MERRRPGYPPLLVYIFTYTNAKLEAFNIQLTVAMYVNANSQELHTNVFIHFSREQSSPLIVNLLQIPTYMIMWNFRNVIHFEGPVSHPLVSKCILIV